MDYNKIDNTNYCKKKDKPRKQNLVSHKSIKKDDPNKDPQFIHFFNLQAFDQHLIMKE